MINGKKLMKTGITNGNYKNTTNKMRIYNLFFICLSLVTIATKAQSVSDYQQIIQNNNKTYFYKLFEKNYKSDPEFISRTTLIEEDLEADYTKANVMLANIAVDASLTADDRKMAKELIRFHNSYIALYKIKNEIQASSIFETQDEKTMQQYIAKIEALGDLSLFAAIAKEKETLLGRLKRYASFYKIKHSIDEEKLFAEKKYDEAYVESYISQLESLTDMSADKNLLKEKESLTEKLKRYKAKGLELRVALEDISKKGKRDSKVFENYDKAVAFAKTAKEKYQEFPYLYKIAQEAITNLKTVEVAKLIIVKANK